MSLLLLPVVIVMKDIVRITDIFDIIVFSLILNDMCIVGCFIFLFFDIEKLENFMTGFQIEITNPKIFLIMTSFRGSTGWL